ncbi:cellulose biosynthesis cyclic di-GMP-binding regulatory protein BcsB [Viridibacillus sp. FSL R5-0888]|uniref:cellulose biosynthesis cyclic di-GMP-binding regulatory protein BcsB n=1 Tax=Viridibacillus sp. FSL R5-0888 TaxID=2921663 RepID=UPI0030F9441B
MKQYQLLIASLLCIIIVALAPTKSEANTTISANGIKVNNVKDTNQPQPFTNAPITLNGPAGEVTFYYELVADAKGKESKIVLNTENSELLIAPSSLSVSVDNKMVKSIAINGDKPVREMTIPLKGDALKEGIHAVTVKYYGVLKEGMCVKQGTSANWLTLNINSYYQLEGLVKKTDVTLGDYPANFVGTEEQPVYIVMPDKPSTNTLNSALQMTNFLSNQSGRKNAVQITRESKIKELNQNVVFIGVPSEFSNSNIKKLWQDANVKQTADALHLSIRTLKHGQQETSAMFVTANKATDLEDRIAILTNPQFSKQLSGLDLSVKDIPKQLNLTQNGSATLEQFGAENITLDSQSTNSAHYYYYVSPNTQLNKAFTLNLKLKKSESITSMKEQSELDNSTNIELIVNVNNIPHSVNLRTLADSKDGIYNVSVPIDAKAIKDNRLIDLQFQTTGLGVNDPCKETDEKRWIYIEKDSTFILPIIQNVDEQKGITFAAFPYPFVSTEGMPIVVLPKKTDVLDEQLLKLYNAILQGVQQPTIQLKTAEQVTAKDAEKANVIFIGGPNEQPLLQKKVNDLIVSYKGNKAVLSDEGFVSETVQQFSWIQENPWSKGNHSILVIDHQGSTPDFMENKFLDEIINSDELATVAVQSSDKQFFTNAEYVKTNKQLNVDSENGKINNSISKWWIVGFAGLLLMIGLLIFRIKRRKNKKLR